MNITKMYSVNNEYRIKFFNDLCISQQMHNDHESKCIQVSMNIAAYTSMKNKYKSKGIQWITQQVYSRVKEYYNKCIQLTMYITAYNFIE